MKWKSWVVDTDLLYYVVRGGPGNEILTRSNSVKYHGVKAGETYNFEVAVVAFTGEGGKGGGQSAFAPKTVVIRE